MRKQDREIFRQETESKEEENRKKKVRKERRQGKARHGMYTLNDTYSCAPSHYGQMLFRSQPDTVTLYYVMLY